MLYLHGMSVAFASFHRFVKSIAYTSKSAGAVTPTMLLQLPRQYAVHTCISFCCTVLQCALPSSQSAPEPCPPVRAAV
jgi:hypothetical protein